MKYGNLQIRPPKSFAEDKAALADLLAKGEIDQETYNAKKRVLDKEFGMFIAQTNDLVAVMSKVRSQFKKQTLSEWRSSFTREKSMEIAKQLAHTLSQEVVENPEAQPVEESPSIDIASQKDSS